MYINGPTQLHGPQSISGPHRAGGATQTLEPTSRFDTVDQVDISAEADIVSRVRETPDIRADKVAQIKAQIADGSYFSDDKLDIALERLLDEFG
ncbi:MULTISPECIES: flagellar biosynthesis anti-sigma factor FlgM [Blastopirellula]|uniref:Anti-sigma-28 factor FlgM C-terminal domain-containing protein n=1 Tax=Blastopirellula marina DSM 3645 TaxID=314230 RepID=A3ZQY7_9BACT|nr:MULTISPECIES: flagellar biosynthesis anti-sigma factor FlgM [Blastopirellula]EAQ81080.1 hypothetical protein DSM3645_20952 [Blastopirellula marina DSM 3645]UUO08287.1 flagellar biosynthesis anti-sigma factor FlgM [Blastopirellula sp. J2-11]